MSLFHNYGVRCNRCGATFVQEDVGTTGAQARAAAGQAGWKHVVHPATKMTPKGGLRGMHAFDYCPECPVDEVTTPFKPQTAQPHPALLPRRLADYVATVLKALKGRGSLQHVDLVDETLRYLEPPPPPLRR